MCHRCALRCSIYNRLIFDLLSLFAFLYIQAKIMQDWQYFRHMHSKLSTWITLDMIFVYLAIRMHMCRPIRLVHLRGPSLICMFFSGVFGIALVNSITNRVKEHNHILDRYFFAVLILIVLSVILLVAYLVLFCVMLTLYKRGIELDDLELKDEGSPREGRDNVRPHAVSFRDVIERSRSHSNTSEPSFVKRTRKERQEQVKGVRWNSKVIDMEDGHMRNL